MQKQQLKFLRANPVSSHLQVLQSRSVSLKLKAYVRTGCFKDCEKEEKETNLENKMWRKQAPEEARQQVLTAKWLPTLKQLSSQLSSHEILYSVVA